MTYTREIPDTIVDSLERWLDSDHNVLFQHMGNGETRRQRRIKTVEEALDNHVDEFLRVRVALFPPTSPELEAAQKAFEEAQKTLNAARDTVVKRSRLGPV